MHRHGQLSLIVAYVPTKEAADTNKEILSAANSSDIISTATPLTYYTWRYECCTKLSEKWLQDYSGIILLWNNKLEFCDTSLLLHFL